MSAVPRIKRLIAISHRHELPFHPAKQAHSYDTIKNDDTYMIGLETELDDLKNALDDMGSLSSTFKCLAYISSADKIEKTVTQQRNMLDRLDQELDSAQSRLQQEVKLNDELIALRLLLEKRLEEINKFVTRGPDTIVTEIQVKNNELRKNTKLMLSELKYILSEYVAPNLLDSRKASEQEQANNASDLRKLVEALLNKMFESKEDGGYVRVRKPDNPIVHFLLAGQLITQLQQDPTYIKLRDFGKD